jgi:hypothetical protein
MNKLENFLKELAELTQKYGIGIGGCGCYGSPYLYDLKNDEFCADDLFYNEKLGVYEVTQ